MNDGIYDRYSNEWVSGIGVELAMMKNILGRGFFGMAVVSATIAVATVAPAQMAAAASPVTLDNVAQVERISLDANGQEVVALKAVAGEKVVPGDVIRYTLTFNNNGTEPASNLQAVNPVPAEIEFIEANEDWAEISVDGGTVWGKLADMTVTETAADTGETSARAAQARDVTHVRWTIKDAIVQGGKASVSYRGRIK